MQSFHNAGGKTKMQIKQVQKAFFHFNEWQQWNFLAVLWCMTLSAKCSANFWNTDCRLKKQSFNHGGVRELFQEQMEAAKFVHGNKEITNNHV